MQNETQQYTRRHPGQSAKSATSYSNKMGQVHCNQTWVNLSVLTFAVLCITCKLEWALFMNENAAVTSPLLSNQCSSISIIHFAFQSALEALSALRIRIINGPNGPFKDYEL